MNQRLTRIAMLLMVLVLALAGCRESQQDDDNEGASSDVSITVSYDPNPPAVGDATLLITLTDADGDAISDATVSVRGDMDHAGMVPVEGEAEGGEDGVYSIPFEWTMGGDWILTVTATLEDGSTVTEEVEVNGVSSDGGMDMDMTEEAGMDMDMTEESDMPDMEMTEETDG